MLTNRGIKRHKISDRLHNDLCYHFRKGTMGLIAHASDGGVVWSMPNHDRTQYTMGILRRVGGRWAVSGWAAEHLICLSRGEPMPTIESSEPFLKPRVRRMVLAHGPKCHLCTHPLSFGDITIEHWLAKSRKGTDSPRNLKLAHRRCNERAGSLTIAEKTALRPVLKREMRSVIESKSLAQVA